MEIHTNHRFNKSYKKRVIGNKRLMIRFQERIDLLQIDSSDETLRIHELTGKMKGYFAFSITGDIRVIFQKISEDEIILIDIGTHNQVY